MTDAKQQLQVEIDEIDQTLRSLHGERGTQVDDEGDQSDSAADLTNYEEEQALIANLEARRQSLVERLAAHRSTALKPRLHAPGRWLEELVARLLHSSTTIAMSSNPPMRLTTRLAAATVWPSDASALTMPSPVMTQVTMRAQFLPLRTCSASRMNSTTKMMPNTTPDPDRHVYRGIELVRVEVGILLRDVWRATCSSLRRQRSSDTSPRTAAANISRTALTTDDGAGPTATGWPYSAGGIAP